ncbi:MAG: MBL fold metallo-hydrolase [Deltaproteobacteria bacterium]|nr:MBL fold metallo-hydrolase [Deltaproteobacteria bacterium]
MKIFHDLYAFIWMDPSANNCNTYLIDRELKILVDPGHEHLFGHVREKLAGLSIALGDIDLVLVTHAHPDHMEGIHLFSKTDTVTAVFEEETAFNEQMASQFGQALAVTPLEPEILLREGELKAGDLTLQVYHTPGHSPGSVCFYWPERKVLFSGDVLFFQGVGRTDLPGGDGSALKESIRRLSRLDVETLLPGHGPIISGREEVKANFEEIERTWFAYL